MKFSVADYWKKRYAKNGDAAVALGSCSKSYRAQIPKLTRAADQLDLTGGGHSVDFGSGVGRFIPYLTNRYERVTAIELASYGRERIGEHYPEVDVHETTMDIPDDSVDLIWAALVLQHIVDDGEYLDVVNELRRIAKPGARLAIVESVNSKARHSISREPADHLDAFNCGGWWQVVDIDSDCSHYIISGVFA